MMKKRDRLSGKTMTLLDLPYLLDNQGTFIPIVSLHFDTRKTTVYTGGVKVKAIQDNSEIFSVSHPAIDVSKMKTKIVEATVFLQDFNGTIVANHVCLFNADDGKQWELARWTQIEAKDCDIFEDELARRLIPDIIINGRGKLFKLENDQVTKLADAMYKKRGPKPRITVVDVE